MEKITVESLKEKISYAREFLHPEGPASECILRVIELVVDYIEYDLNSRKITQEEEKVDRPTDHFPDATKKVSR